MELSIIQSDIEKIDLPIILIGLTEDNVIEKKHYPINDHVNKIVELGDFIGEKGSSILIYPSNIKSKRVLLVGLGKKEKLEIEIIRNIIGTAARKVRDLGVKHIGIHLSSFTSEKCNLGDVAEALVQSVIMGVYNETYYKTKDLEKFKKINKVTLFDSNPIKEIQRRAEMGRVIGEAVNYCRRLSWGPGNIITPTHLAVEAERIGKKYNIKVNVFDREKAKEIGLHSFLAVARGTEEPPKFIILEYGRKKENVDTVALVGKGITFDTGGISLKPGTGMPLMKADMTGGAVVLSVMEAVARFGLDLHVVGLVPATDNMPDGRAYHPGDVIRSYSGQTIEVISTDAEGRMVINDALTYAAKNYNPDAMLDFATLTGAMHVTIGDHAIGYFANTDWIAEKIEEASKTSGERVWRMPLWDVYDEQIKSDVADMKHTGGRPAGAITAARFLSKFVLDKPWAHFDIAGHPEQKSNVGYNPKGSKGPAVRLVIETLRKWNE
jgi:leucyl aminopeptidase